MRYSIEPRDRIYVKGYGFLSFAKNIRKNFSNKYGQNLLDSGKKSTTVIFYHYQEDFGNSIGNKIADKITSSSKKSPKELQNDKMEAPKKSHKSPQERQQIIDELRLV